MQSRNQVADRLEDVHGAVIDMSIGELQLIIIRYSIKSGTAYRTIKQKG